MILDEIEKMETADKERLIKLAGYYKFFKVCGITAKGTVMEIKDILNKYEIKYVDDILEEVE